MKCKPSKNKFISTYFFGEKKDGSKRFILKLKPFNYHVIASHSKLEDTRTAFNLIDAQSFVANVDLQDAYLLVPVHIDNRKFFRFVFQGTVYEFKCLPFGFCMSPFIFTKIMKPVVNKLRNEGWISCIYLDDFLCVGNTCEECESQHKCNFTFSRKTLTGWGAYANRQRSRGLWSATEVKNKINQLELMPAFTALKNFASEASNCELLLRLGNKMAISYINKMGGTHVWGLNEISRDIWKWCAGRDILQYASFIPSNYENTQTDKESGISNVDTEWQLSDNTFKTITNNFSQKWTCLIPIRISSANHTKIGTEILSLI